MLDSLSNAACPNVTAILLAGGQSRRMGSNKAHLAIGNRPLWQYMASLLNVANFKQIIISGPEGIPDLIPGKGPMSGLHTCLDALPGSTETQGLLMLPVDMPLLTPELLVHLATQGYACQTPLHYENYQLPLYLPVNEALRNYTQAVVHETDKRHYSLRRLIAHLHGSTLPVPDGQEWRFRNANTPEDWRQCLADA